MLGNGSISEITAKLKASQIAKPDSLMLNAALEGSLTLKEYAKFIVSLRQNGDQELNALADTLASAPWYQQMKFLFTHQYYENPGYDNNNQQISGHSSQAIERLKQALIEGIVSADISYGEMANKNNIIMVFEDEESSFKVILHQPNLFLAIKEGLYTLDDLSKSCNPVVMLSDVGLEFMRGGYITIEHYTGEMFMSEGIRRIVTAENLPLFQQQKLTMAVILEVDEDVLVDFMLQDRGRALLAGDFLTQVDFRDLSDPILDVLNNEGIVELFTQGILTRQMILRFDPSNVQFMNPDKVNNLQLLLNNHIGRDYLANSEPEAIAAILNEALIQSRDDFVENNPVLGVILNQQFIM